MGTQGPRQAANPAGARRHLERSPEQLAAARHRHQPRSGGALRHPAPGHRRHPQRRLRPAPGRAILHADQHLYRGAGSAAVAARQSRHARHDLSQIAVDRRAGAALDPRHHRQSAGRSAFGVASGAVPGGDDLLQPAQGRGARPVDRRHRQGGDGDGQAGLADRDLPGQRPSLPVIARQRADPDRRGARGRLRDPRHAL